MTVPPPPHHPMPLLPNPAYREPGQHLKRGPLCRYLWEVHGIVSPRMFVALMSPMVALLIFCLVMATRGFATGNY